MIGPGPYRTLCESCTRCKLVVSGTGSRFYLCRLAQTDRRFVKYPPQPVVRCSGYEAGVATDRASNLPGADD